MKFPANASPLISCSIKNEWSCPVEKLQRMAATAKTTAVLHNGGTSMLQYQEQVVMPMEALQRRLHQLLRC
jgi:hypothetical protein